MQTFRVYRIPAHALNLASGLNMKAKIAISTQTSLSLSYSYGM